MIIYKFYTDVNTYIPMFASVGRMSLNNIYYFDVIILFAIVHTLNCSGSKNR